MATAMASPTRVTDVRIKVDSVSQPEAPTGMEAGSRTRAMPAPPRTPRAQGRTIDPHGDQEVVHRWVWTGLHLGVLTHSLAGLAATALENPHLRWHMEGHQWRRSPRRLGLGLP
jgi:hypothetical protein